MTRNATEGDATEAPSLEKRLARIDEIVQALDDDSVELSRALALYEEGMEHVKQAEAVLSEAELRVTELAGPDGGREVDLDLEGGDGPVDV